MPPDQNKRIITVPEAGRMLGFGRAQSYAHAAAGLLPVVRFGRKLLVPVRALEQLEDEAARAAVAEQVRRRSEAVQ